MPPTHWLRGRMDPSHTCGVLQRHRTIHKHGRNRPCGPKQAALRWSRTQRGLITSEDSSLSRLLLLERCNGTHATLAVLAAPSSPMVPTPRWPRWRPRTCSSLPRRSARCHQRALSRQSPSRGIVSERKGRRNCVPDPEIECQRDVPRSH